MEEWLSPRGSQTDLSFFSKEDKQKSKQIEDLAPEREIIINQAPEGEISTMVVITWSYAIKGERVKLYGTLGDKLYKEYRGSIVPWSVTDPDAKLNSFIWSKEDNYWIVLGYHYNENFKNCIGPIHNGKLFP